MNKSFNIFMFILLMLYALSWTSILWEITGDKRLTMWYWIAHSEVSKESFNKGEQI